jgi:threonine/homoserine/homoserine lactone efflux protein
MNVVLTGMALGLLVSMPPGPNAMLCMNLANGGVRRAIPLITSAALTDAMYSLLAASGVLLASHASSRLLAFFVPCFMIGAAVLAWSPQWMSPGAGAWVAALNPSTAAIWLSLSSLPTLQMLSPPDVLARALPVALGTAAWFTLLAVVAAKLSHRIGPERTVGMQRLLAGSLGVLGLISLIAAVS